VIRLVLDRARRVMFTGAAFLCFFLGGALLAYTVLPAIALATRDPALRARRCRRAVARAWCFFHDALRVLRLVSYDPRRAGLTLPEGPYVAVANHPTLIDVTALLATVPDLVVVAKQAMIRNPFVGPVLRRCDHIDAGDGGPFSGAAVVDQALARLRAGTSVLLFPEGTRSPEGGLGAFRQGAFELAVRAGVPLVSFLVRCEPPTLMRGQAWYEVPQRTSALTVAQLPTLTPECGVAQLGLRVTGRYRAELGLPADGSTPAPRSRRLAAAGGA
jgi:1-acyl-sn-glycerol-3-phosphate acyltransferase